MNCTQCGQSKQKRNLEGGVCRSCRREASLSEILSSPLATYDVVTSYPPDEVLDEYEPSLNAHVEGEESLSLDEFSQMHHNQQTRYLKVHCQIYWRAGEDRVELYRGHLGRSID